MTRRVWVRLDNASNVFLAARSATDSKVFRLGAELDHEVIPGLLQEALDATYDRYRLYHAVLRRGVFWYYLQDSDLRPLVTADELPACAPIYQQDRRHLLFRVSHHRRRITLEVFHALSDGAGALWFLSDLVTAYVRLRHPDSVDPTRIGAGAASVDAGTTAVDGVAPTHELAADSFHHYFRRDRRRAAPRSSPSSLAWRCRRCSRSQRTTRFRLAHPWIPTARAGDRGGRSISSPELAPRTTAREWSSSPCRCATYSRWPALRASRSRCI